MRKFIASSIAMLLILMFSVSAFAGFNTVVDDGASLFTEYDILNIDDAANELAAETDFSVAIVTTDDAMGKSAMEFADDYYDSLIFDKGWSENGILFLIDMDNREIYVSCAGLCIDEYSDYELNLIIDSGYSYITQGEYSECVVSMIYNAEKLALESDENSSYYEDDDFVITYGGEYEDEYYYNDDYYYEENGGFSLSHVLIYIVIGIAVGGIAVFAVKSSYKNMGKGDEFNADDVSLELTASNDNVISKNVITTKIPKNNNNNHKPGGRGGGGVSVHRSSGGVRHSGAGRKF